MGGQTGAPGDLAEGNVRAAIYCDETKTPTGPGQPAREGPPAHSEQYADRNRRKTRSKGPRGNPAWDVQAKHGTGNRTYLQSCDNLACSGAMLY